DMDESNATLHRQLGLRSPRDLIEYFGGRKKFSQEIFSKLKGKSDEEIQAEIFGGKWRLANLPEGYVEEKNGIKLLSIGKIHDYGEGCACPMGGLARAFLGNLELGEGEIVLVDSDAGVEHFGRGVEASCDLILAVIDPTFESVRLSKLILEMAGKLGKPAYLVLNKVDREATRLLLEQVDKEKVLAVIPQSREIFLACLKGEEVDVQLGEVEKLADRLLSLLSR
ncbi:ATP-binding protein, partial [Candidatus Bathyarchaeota archaeon]